jgi:hypothetical protein
VWLSSSVLSVRGVSSRSRTILFPRVYYLLWSIALWARTTDWMRHGRRAPPQPVKGTVAMTLPGFHAETSLYKTSVHYRLKGISVQAGGVMPQLFLHCGPCFRDATGACVKNCTFCVGFLPLCFSRTRPCSPSACQDDCTIQCPQCNASVGCARSACCCRCLGGFLHRDLNSPCGFDCILM